MKKKLLSMLLSLLCITAATAMPVEDITLTTVTPKPGELDTHLRSLEQITLIFNMEIEVGENKSATLSLPNGTTLTAPLVKNRFNKKAAILEFPEVMPLNGTYTLTIKRWSVGDAEWLENDEAGHSNATLTVEWTVSDGLSTDVEYNLNPISISPANNASIDYNNGGQTLSKVQIVMPEGSIMNPDAQIHLSCTEARYEQQLTFVAEAKGNNIAYTADVSPAPSMSGNYTLLIPGGSFGDADFINEGKGHANPPISYLYVVTGNVSEDGELLDGVSYSEIPTAIKLVRENDEYAVSFRLGSAVTFKDEKVTDCVLLDEFGYKVADAAFSLFRESDNAIPEIHFTAQLDSEKRYTLLIPQGLYGNESWVNSEYKRGIANPQLRQDFIPSQVTSGIEEVTVSETDAPRTVYTATGIMLYRDATDAQIQSLAPGFYIIGGKKVIVK